ncbi:flagellar basal-body rod modification protein FlgD [Psychromonas ingrahamii 37]|uniref:Basal-body rod modification protein FlgD n=1 Tax=Psychromonas ingrahamii (strain DSM 17664 / CCUG 51855 / 37) TaxID=357804 RepID=A1T0J4_PSYIN|nr:flagellar hook assembly protein FlgD [Psychromonas ingrahamii]ABM05259.1 flagellar basal-body rod modification protein FlgD [Psychromonas ingrahamii 37]
MALSESSVLGADVAITQMASQTKTIDANPNDSSSLKNEFITLMVAQIQNQDPLNPGDGTEYVSQLAQFSQVESAENMVSLMQRNSVMMDNLQVLATASLVGQEVMIRSDKFSVDGEPAQNLSGQVVLTSPSSQVNLLINDQFGQIKKVVLGPQAAGQVDFKLDVEALNLAKGAHSVSVELSNGQEYQPQILLSGKIESINIPATGGASMISLRGLGSVPFYDISQFGGAN